MDVTGSTSSRSYKPVEYNKIIYLIPIRFTNQNKYILLSDLQAIIPTTSAVLSNDKLVPFELNPNTLMEVQPKRIVVNDIDSVWQIHTPPINTEVLDKLSYCEQRLNFLIRRLVEEEEVDTCNAQLDNIPLSNSSVSSTNSTSYHQQLLLENNDRNSHIDIEDNDLRGRSSRGTNSSRRQQGLSPPPAFSLHHTDTSNSSTVHSNIPSTSTIYTNESNRSSDVTVVISNHQPSNTTNSDYQRDNDSNDNVDNNNHPNSTISNNPSSTNPNAIIPPPPSYETSIFGNISLLVQKLRLFEEHIPNRHKSPRWLARRHEWVSNEPMNIEQIAYQLIQLEIALLWTAVEEVWINERETWLTLVAGARSERHLAGAMVNLERHTLVMDDDWQHCREDWLNELLEIIVSTSF
ncbi:unnamed protein product [Cunninghamella blakesleeana]